MEIKLKVSDVAKDFSKNSKEIIDLLSPYVNEPKKSSNVLSEDEMSLIFELLTKKYEVKSFDEYFKSGEKAQTERKQKKEAEKQRKLAEQAAILEQFKAAAAAEIAAKNKPAAVKPEEAITFEKEEDKVKEVKLPSKKETPAKKAEKGKTYTEKLAEMKKSKQKDNGNEYIPVMQKKEKQGGPAPNRGPASVRLVDTRTSQVELDKYNEKYENIAPAYSMKDNVGRKQKIKQKSQEYRRPHGTKRETEADKMRRIQLERIKKTPLTITIPEEISVQDLAAAMKKTAAEVIKVLMKYGVMATITQNIDYDTAEIVATDLGCKVKKAVVVTIEERIMDISEDSDEDLLPRDPVVVVMGHVDHGKTSLLDAIRNAKVTEGEAGGITQHIGAYRVNHNGQNITFLDTPGHAAFTAMRQRGAMATDIAVLVVAADDGIMPQTIEAINHAKAAKVQIIVAINKMDKPEANPDKIMQQLTEHELVPEEWGGDIICVPVSAKTHMGIDKLLENILLVAEMAELKANPNRRASGVIIEARLDKGRGPVASLLVKNGTLKAGDVIVAGTTVGRIRNMTNENGKELKEAGPSVPVEITGLADVPEAGDSFDAVSDERLARELVEQRREKLKEEEFSKAQKVTLDNLFSQLEAGDMKTLNIIVKADVQGSVEAVKESLIKLSNDEVRVAVIHGGVGAINDSDVMLAATSSAIIVGFNVRPDAVAKESAAREGIDIRTYRVIYECIEEVEAAMKGMLAPKYRDVDEGVVEVRMIYKISSVGTVAGCYVQSGKVTRGSKVRIIRDGVVIADDELASLRREKDDVKEVAAGYECGITLAKFNDIKQGDIFETYIVEEYRD